MSNAVEKLLNANNIPFTVSGKDYLIKCLNPEHEDSNPSYRIDRTTGATHCFSCGWKPNIFKYFGVLSGNMQSIKVAKLKKKLQDLSISLTEVEYPDGFTPFTKNFRGLSQATLKHFGAFYTTREEKLEDRVIFPITDITGKTVAFIARHLLSDANPRYVVYPSGRPLPLFPSKFTEPTKSIVLVEGIVDMLNLYDKGLRNAVCMFGVSTITEDNVATRLMPYKVQGIEKVFLLLDGDDPGRAAATKLKPILEEQGFIAEIIELEDDTDPGSLGSEDIQRIKEYTK